ncbi:alpha/beta hydrolase [Agromyces archimandritae]|uniref:Dienelactone hydrolase family protein n=1 Tax=Agromyces archimandritae TaxID=2781962 RepID=A0A975FPA1_9MICO|nr:dienelactone hydrolase family protein [Agromyces archimandritae]QTX05532.1 dienelactone hydrolase family protein [Agromyces archimandritae]
MPDPTLDDRAVLWSAAGDDRTGRPVLLLLHGYNSDESDLFGLAPYLPLEPVVASLRAPLPAGYGYAWFPLGAPGSLLAPEQTLARRRGADAAVRAVLAWLDERVDARTPVGLLGFSQGGAIAIELLRARPERFAFAAVLAGFALDDAQPGDEELARIAPPVFWGRGTADEVIPAAAVAHTQHWLPEHASLTAGIYEGVGHQISELELRELVAFLRERYA